MTIPHPSPLEALAGLLEERRRFEGWLKQLASRGGETPQHVVERVRADYLKRLENVTAQLRSRAVDIESSAQEFVNHSATLLSQETARRDERAEAELRAAVGEYSAEEANGILARCDEEIARLASQRDAVNTELARIREVLDSVQGPPAVPAAGAAPAPQAAPHAEPAPAPPPHAPPPPLHGTDPSAFDELAFLQSVVQPREGATGGRTAPDFGGAPLGAPRRPAPGGEGGRREAPMPGAAGGNRTAAATPENVPSFLKDAPTEQVKSLKCQECGTMNYPTEWYCERCGGELAAM